MGTSTAILSPWLLDNLRCPSTASKLQLRQYEQQWFLESEAIVGRRQRYPIVNGVPVMLKEQTDPTLWVASASYRQARESADDCWQLDTIGITPEEVLLLKQRVAEGNWKVDPVVDFLIVATSGYLYTELLGKLGQYPIPELRLPPADGARLLDVGCNWGRWCMAAARKGYQPVGIDPSLGAVLAAKRLAEHLGLKVDFVVGDARFLPFAGESFEQGFSYSVLQHFALPDADRAIVELGRVLKPKGKALVQLANVFGIRCLQHQAMRGFRAATVFDVRYWTPNRMLKSFKQSVGPATLSVDGYFGLGIQATDIPLLTGPKQWVVRASEALRRLADWFRPLIYVADSLYVEVKKSGESRTEDTSGESRTEDTSGESRTEDTSGENHRRTGE